jgi:hypothetical protein
VEAALSVSVGVVAAILAWLRLDGRTRGVVWAEDGTFLEDRLGSAPLVSVLDPYQGYLHVLPRSIVELAVLLPTRDYAVAVTGLCCLVVGVVASLVHACSRDVVQSRAARVALALVTVLVPTAPAEALGNTANLHWFLLWLTPWVLLCRPAARWQGWALGTLLLVIGLSEIQAVYFVPLLLMGLRDRLRRPMAAGLLAGVAAQVVVMSGAGREASEHDVGTPSLADLVQGYGLHVFLQMWRPAAGGVGEVLVEQGWSLVLLASLPFVLLLGVLLVGTVRAVARRRPGAADDIVLVTVVLGGAVVPYVVGMVLNFRSFLAFSELDLETLAGFAPLRYALVPSMFVLAAVVVVADRLAQRPGRPGGVLAGGLLAGLALVLVLNLDAGPTNRSGFPGWAAGVAAAERECRGGATRVEIGIAPEAWEVDLACADLTAGGPRR